MADYTKQSPAAAAVSQYRKDVATMGSDAAHAKLMHDVDLTTASVARSTAATKATLEANDPGSTDPSRTDIPGVIHSDGKPLIDPRISNKHSAPGD